MLYAGIPKDTISLYVGRIENNKYICNVGEGEGVEERKVRSWN